MPLLDHCFCCTLRVAASVISVYVAVAYMIAFFMELWWVWDTGGQLPHLGYILISAYFVTFILSAILVKGISDKQMPHLLLWLFGVLAILLPEGGLVLFMSFQFWKIYTIYGLTEITFWICRLIVNVAGIICIHSLYRLWKEEKQVISSLRDLNMASRSVLAGVRRPSVSSLKAVPGYTNPGYNGSQPDHTVLIPRSNLRRSPSLRSLPPRAPSPSPSVNEFNAALFASNLKSRSVLDLRQQGFVQQQQQQPKPPIPAPRLLSIPPPPDHRVPPPPGYHHLLHYHQQQQKQKQLPPGYHTQSLDRRLLHRAKSLGGFFPTEDRMRNGYFSPLSVSGFIVDPNGRVAYIQDQGIGEKPWVADSKTSIESDDMHKYRDVAL